MRSGPADTGAGNSVPPPANDQYTDNGAGPVSGGAIGAAAPGSEQDFVVNVGDRVLAAPGAGASLPRGRRWVRR